MEIKRANFFVGGSLPEYQLREILMKELERVDRKIRNDFKASKKEKKIYLKSQKTLMNNERLLKSLETSYKIDTKCPKNFKPDKFRQ